MKTVNTYRTIEAECDSLGSIKVQLKKYTHVLFKLHLVKIQYCMLSYKFILLTVIYKGEKVTSYTIERTQRIL